MLSELTNKQIKFCEEYMVDLNATQAAIRSGYSKKTANVTAAKMLSKANISDYINKLRAGVTARTEITIDFVVQGLREVALRCMQKTPVMVYDYDDKRLVQKQNEDGNGVWEFDSSGANRALELLGKHIGAFEKDNGQKRPDIRPFNDEQVEKIIQAIKRK